MQQVIEFESSAKELQAIDVRATIQRKIKSLNLWLDSKSEFYSRICEFSVTRRLVIRVNLVTLCVGLAAIAIEQQPITSVVATICAGYLVYRINISGDACVKVNFNGSIDMYAIYCLNFGNQRPLNKQEKKGGKV